MGAVEDGADRSRESACALLALPPLPVPVARGMTRDFLGLAVGAHHLPVPPHLLKVGNGLLLGLEAIEDFDNRHGLTLFLGTTIGRPDVFVKSKSVSVPQQTDEQEKHDGHSHVGILLRVVRIKASETDRTGASKYSTYMRDDTLDAR